MSFQSESQRFSDRSRSRSRSRDGPSQNSDSSDHQGSNSPRERKVQSLPIQGIDQSDPEYIGIELSKAFIMFFEQINHRKAFIMMPKERANLQKQQLKYDRKKLPKIDWTSIAQWDHNQQSAKIEQIFSKKSLPILSKQIQGLKQIFIEVSSMFGKETTSELYQILLEVICMCIKSQRDSQKAVEDFFVVGLKNSLVYYFFNFKFSKITKFILKQNYDDAYRRLGNSLHRHLSLFLKSNK